jgi:hypothetical protein
MAAPLWNPPVKVANDVASVTIAGYIFASDGGPGGLGGAVATGGIVNLRVGMRGRALVDLARALGRIGGVRVTSGPAIASRGDCYLVHCPGFKLVLSVPDPASGFAHALLSRTIAPTLAVTCELGAVFESLLRPPPPRSEATAPPALDGRPAWPKTSTLRRAALQPGKTLARKAPLGRKTPLRRTRWPKR